MALVIEIISYIFTFEISKFLSQTLIISVKGELTTDVLCWILTRSMKYVQA